MKLNYTSLCAIGLVLGLASQSATAQEIDGPVTLVVAYSPGGSTDIMARTLSDPLSEALGQTVLVENRPGGGTIVGTTGVIESDPDGRTLLYGTNATLLSQVLRDNENYDPLTDLTPVARVTTQPLAVLAHPGLEADSIQGLVEFAQEHPGEVNFASSGNASLQHIAGEMLMSAGNFEMTHIPYTGAGPALTDLLAGRADIMITSLAGVQGYVDSGELIVLATTGPERSPVAPDVPTVAESGYPGFSAMSYQGIFAPRDTPESVVVELNQALQDMVTDELRATVEARGMTLEVTTPEEMTAYLEQQQQAFGSIISEVGITLD